MLGMRSEQLGMLEADLWHPGDVGQDSDCGFLARHRDDLSRAANPAGSSTPDLGPPLVPPSMLEHAQMLTIPDKIEEVGPA